MPLRDGGACKFIQSRGWRVFYVMGQIVNILDFEGHVVSVTRLCHCNIKATIDST